MVTGMASAEGASKSKAKQSKERRKATLELRSWLQPSELQSRAVSPCRCGAVQAFGRARFENGLHAMNHVRYHFAHAPHLNRTVPPSR